MAFPDTPMPISELAQAAVLQYCRSSMTLFITQYNIRHQLLLRDKAYYREQDRTTPQQRAKLANQNDDASKMQNVTLPVVMPQTESALTYLAEVFLSGYPIFASYAPPDQQEEMKQFDAITIDNSTRFGWVSELQKILRDGLKYDFGVCEVSWETVKVASVETPQASKLDEGTPTEEAYSGNRIKHLNAYNVILDPRVPPEENYKRGEFSGYLELISRIECLQRMANLDKTKTMNFKRALESGLAQTASNSSDTEGYYVPDINPDALIPAGQTTEFDWLKWASLANPQGGGKIVYRNSYTWTVMYCRILPRDFNIRGKGPDGKDINPDQVQIWKFIVINSQIVIFAQRMTNAHNYLPMLVAKPSNDGFGYQSKSFAQNAEPYQQASTALFNSGMASQRRKVYDRLLYDPMRVNKKDIENTSPVARIPVRNSQMGKGLSDAVAPIPYRDEEVGTAINMSQQVVQMAEVMNGQNRVTQGQFQKGNKTRREFDVVMNNSSSRPKMQALGLEYTFFTPLKEIIKTNVLQYQQPMTVLPNTANSAAVEVDPAKLRASIVQFTLSDGLISTEKMSSLDVVNQLLQAATAMPQIAQEYDIMGMMAYSWQLQGLNWIDKFKYSQQQQMQRAQQQGAMAAAGQPPAAPGGSPAAPDAGAQGAA